MMFSDVYVRNWGGETVRGTPVLTLMLTYIDNA